MCLCKWLVVPYKPFIARAWHASGLDPANLFGQKATI